MGLDTSIGEVDAADVRLFFFISMGCCLDLDAR